MGPLTGRCNSTVSRPIIDGLNRERHGDAVEPGFARSLTAQSVGMPITMEGIM